MCLKSNKKNLNMCPKDLADHVLSASGEIHNVKLKGLVSQDAKGLQIILV